MRLVSPVAAACLAAVLASCGQSNTTTVGGNRITQTKDGDTTTYQVTSPTGETAQISTGDDAAKNLPAYAPLYPGATVTTSYSGNGAQGAGGVVAFKTAAPVADIIKFYKDKAAASGLANGADVTMSGSTMYTASNDANKAGLQVTVTPASDGSGSDVTLIWSAPNGG